MMNMKDKEKEQPTDELISCLERLDNKLDAWLRNAAKVLVEDYGKEKTLKMFPELEEYLQDE